MNDLFSATLLILDEIGGGHDPTGFGVDKLCELLSAREQKWTIVTTNITPAAWPQIFDRRITSRFFRNSTIVDLTGVPDFSLISTKLTYDCPSTDSRIT